MEIFAFHPGLNKWVEIGNSGMFRPEMLLPMGLPGKFYINEISIGLPGKFYINEISMGLMISFILVNLIFIF